MWTNTRVQLLAKCGFEDEIEMNGGTIVFVFVSSNDDRAIPITQSTQSSHFQTWNHPGQL